MLYPGGIPCSLDTPSLILDLEEQARYREQLAGCTVHVHQAQNGRNPWVVDILIVQDPKGVIVLRHVCAELLSSSR